MATSIIDKTACAAAGQGQETGLLPINPYTALEFHFGMLLGVDDLETLQAYPRGKLRLHNAWLHGRGVVWGLGVAFDARNELKVAPGLALDAAGHELHLDRPACLDLGQWYAENQDNGDFSFQIDESKVKFSVRVVARFKACLTRPVPAIVEPCEGAQTDTAYSRVFETLDLLLRPLLPEAPAAGDRGFHRLRILFRIEDDPEAEYPEVLDRRQAIEALPGSQQPAAYRAALREFAALDVTDLKPQQATEAEPASIFPEDPTEVLLAEIKDILLEQNEAGGWSILEPISAPDVKVRSSLIPTAVIQELLCGPLFTQPIES